MHRIHRCGAFFVTRAKTNSRFQRRYSCPVDKSTGLLFDQTVMLTAFVPSNSIRTHCGASDSATLRPANGSCS